MKVYELTEIELLELINKLNSNIDTITSAAGEYSIGSRIKQSVKSTINNFVKTRTV